MKHFLLSIICSSFSCIFFGCKKECPQSTQTIDTIYINPPVNSVKDYFPLTQGSYWIYQQFHKDTSGNFVPFGSIDSMYVYSDTVIHTDTFSVLRETLYSVGLHSDILRDSSDYIVDEHGAIYFSSMDFIDTLYSLTYAYIGYVDYKMDATDSLIEIPIGTFQAADFKGYVHAYSCPDTLRYIYNFYAKNIGRIKSSGFYMSSFCLPEQNWIEERLIRYHIEQ